MIQSLPSHHNVVDMHAYASAYSSLKLGGDDQSFLTRSIRAVKVMWTIEVTATS